MKNRKKEECTCCIEYDENGYPIECLCPKHREQEEAKLKKIYNLIN